MAPVKQGLPIKDFVVSVGKDSLEKPAKLKVKWLRLCGPDSRVVREELLTTESPKLDFKNKILTTEVKLGRKSLLL